MEVKFEIIRGKRINDQLEEQLALLTERSTQQELSQNTDNFEPATRKRQEATQPVIVKQLVTLPFVGTKTLNVEAFISNTASKSKDPTNDVRIIFNQVVFEDENTNENISFIAKDGKEYYMQPIDLGSHTVRVNCTCLDFFWRFKSYNAKDQSLAGNAPPPYQKVPGSTRGPSNPQRVPGLCKHLLKTFDALKESGMVT
jgi:hypothetical protein